MKKAILFIFLTIFFNKVAIGIEEELIDAGFRFLENPADLFFNLGQNIEDTSPVLAKDFKGIKNKYITIRTTILPVFLPVTLGNLAVKIRINSEKDYIPQVGFSFGFGRVLIFDFIPTEDIPKPQNMAYYYSLVISKTFEDTIIYLGTKYSEFSIKLKLSEQLEFYGEKIDEFNFNANDIFLFSGIMLPKRNKVVFAQMGYGFKYRKIVARLAAEYNSVQLGLDIFPEGLLVLHPYFALSIKF
ncbi:MAG: hypothetical protein ABDH23_02380 [Endomicrobiia bacterium]